MANKKFGELVGIGYEGFDVESFGKVLKANGVNVVCDVRKNAISRKKGFSKNKLKEALAKYAIDYLHLPGLGIPSEVRQKAKGAAAWERMLNNYEHSLRSPDWDPIMHLLAEKKKVALLCFEKDPECCHRTRLAHRISEDAKLTVHEIPRGT